MYRIIGLLPLLLILLGPQTRADSLPDLIDRIRPGIVGVGTIQKTRRPPNRLLGTGFAIADGSLIATNAHVIPLEMNSKRREFLAVFIGRGKEARGRRATVLAMDRQHDVTILKMEGPPLPALPLGDPRVAREGEAIAFTGFPIGAILGLYPVTHIGIISALTPIVIPARSSHELTAEQIHFLRHPFQVFQLDATAYPGNSGSPMYNRTTGKVIGIINMVFVKGKKENVLKDPSAISYAIPIDYLKALLKQLRD